MSEPLSESIQHYLREIFKLRQDEGKATVTALSLHSYPLVQDRYVLLPHGASMGSGYGPVVVWPEPLTRAELREVEIAVPGRMTTAFLVLRMYLGEWWLLETGLPLPLGINVARRDLGEEVLHDLSEVLRESIRAGLDNREEAMQYAMQFGRGLDERLADRFVGMYVNELTEDYGDEGRKAVQELLRRAEAIGFYGRPVTLSFIS